jgi:Ca-activated chloride channel homolog
VRQTLTGFFHFVFRAASAQVGTLPLGPKVAGCAFPEESMGNLGLFCGFAFCGVISAAWGCSLKTSSRAGAGGTTSAYAGVTVADGTTGYAATLASAGVGGSAGISGTGTGMMPPPEPDPIALQQDCSKLDQAKPLVLYVSADDSNSMASPARAREEIAAKVPPQALRGYEFLNYYGPSLGYAAPPAGQLALSAELAKDEAPGDLWLQLGVRSFDPVMPRRPKTLTFVLDTSGSMSGPGIARERAAVLAIAGQLAQGDIVNMVTWNTANQVVLAGHSVAGPNDAKLVAIANGLSASGGTDLHQGLVGGFELAKKYYGADRLNRVILVSDGGANVGITDADLIAAHAKDADQDGIYLVGIGTGPAGVYADHLMDVVTDKGRGAYVYLDDPKEAAKILGGRFDEVFEIAARSVQIKLTVPWYFQVAKFFGEQMSVDPKQVEPQHLAPGASMVVTQMLHACDPLLVNDADPVTIEVTWQWPNNKQPAQKTLTTTVGALLAGPTTHLAKGRAILDYADAMAHCDKALIASAVAAVTAVNPAKSDAGFNEMAALLAAHPCK